jgi:hypothetical protein
MGTGGAAQVVHLFCKCEALNSNPSPTKKKKSSQGKVSRNSTQNSLWRAEDTAGGSSW